MRRKYLEDIGINFDTKYYVSQLLADSREEEDEQAYEERGVLPAECFSLDYTLCCFVYERLNAYYEDAKDCIDLTYHKYLVNILTGFHWKSDYIADPIYKEVELTLEECIITILMYLRGTIEEKEDNDDYDFKEESMNYHYRQAAFQILAVIINSLWW